FGSMAAEGQGSSILRRLTRIFVSCSLLYSFFTGCIVCVHALDQAVERQIESIKILPLHGKSREYTLLVDALDYIKNYDEQKSHAPLDKYEIVVKYNNGDKIEVEFKEKSSAIIFLSEYS
ncbi:hypothetical protein, partial [Paenibacillus campi]|uniref:hypothetical protein n=1 Tax=Paenibacillus campi TaxID=3106031 RepID=UPI002AFF84E4